MRTFSDWVILFTVALLCVLLALAATAVGSDRVYDLGDHRVYPRLGWDAPDRTATPAAPSRLTEDGSFVYIGYWEEGSPGLVYKGEDDPGGGIFSRLYEYWMMEWDYKRIRFEADCASACTFFLGIISPERVCAGPDARFGIHGASINGYYARELTEWVFSSVYPPVVGEVTAEKGWYRTQQVDRRPYPDGVVWLDRDDLGIKHCPEEEG